MFLGGIMVVVIYIASLAANEKLVQLIWPSLKSFILVPVFYFLGSDSGTFSKILSTSSFAGDAYGLYFTPLLIFCFGLLFLAMVRAINLIKLEEGPLVKRL
jgi:hypothetical protein